MHCRRTQMAGTINYLYNPAQGVFVITEACDDLNGVIAVREGVVKFIRGDVLTSGSTITYGVSLTGRSGNVEYLEVDVFETLAAAVAEYQIRLA